MQKKISARGRNVNTKNEDYPGDVSKMLFDLEPNHFWFQGRNKIIYSLIEKVVKKPKGMTLLEVGCGTGYVLSFLEKKGLEVSGIDIFYKSLKLARERTKAKLIFGDFRKTSFSKKYDIIGFFDVIEHIEDDTLFIKRAVKFLNPEGYIVITVPANMLLWSVVDKKSGHKRRYNKNNLTALLKYSGLSIEASSYYNFFLFLPQLLLRKLVKFKKDNNEVLLEGGLRKLPSAINFIFKMLMFTESNIIKYFPLPLGASLIIIGKKII